MMLFTRLTRHSLTIKMSSKKGGLFSLTCVYWCFYILIIIHPITILHTQYIVREGKQYYFAWSID